MTKNNVRFEELMYTDSGSSFKFKIRYNKIYFFWNEIMKISFILKDYKYSL